MLDLYNTIRRHFLSRSSTQLEGNALKRVNTLCCLITGMIHRGSSHLNEISRGIPRNIDSESKTAVAKRFVSNKWTDFSVHFLPFLQHFLTGMFCTGAFDQGVILVIDGSQIGKDNAALMISLVWKKRSIPICWLVKKGGKGHFKTQDHLSVIEMAMEILVPMIPEAVNVTLLGDGEFDSKEIQQVCLAQGWDYVLRTACDTVLYHKGECFHAKDVLPFQGHDCAYMEDVEFTLKRFKYISFVCWHDIKRHEEAIYLVSSLKCAGQIIELYDQRYSIECLFKDIKSTSFNIHKTRLKEPREVFNLIMIASLAFILVVIISINYDCDKWRKRIHRIRKRVIANSFFSFAFKLIKHFMDYSIPFSFNFQISKNESKFFTFAPE